MKKAFIISFVALGIMGAGLGCGKKAQEKSQEVKYLGAAENGTLKDVFEGETRKYESRVRSNVEYYVSRTLAGKHKIAGIAGRQFPGDYSSAVRNLLNTAYEHIDWEERASRAAKEALRSNNYSCREMLSYLMTAGYSTDEGAYGALKAGVCYE